MSKFIERGYRQEPLNALNALVSSEQVHFKQTSERVCTDGRVPDEIWERVPDCGAGNYHNYQLSYHRVPRQYVGTALIKVSVSGWCYLSGLEVER